MIKFIRNRSKYFVVFLLFLAFLQFISYNIKSNYEYNSIDKIILYLVSPIQGFIAHTEKKSKNFFVTYINLINVQKKNDELFTELNRMHFLVNQLEEAKIENQRLRKMLEFKDESPFEIIAAQIISTDATSYGRTIRVNVGKRNRVELDNAVISYNGIIGKVISTLDNYSDVMLITDTNSAIDVLSQRTRARGIARGSINEPMKLSLDFVSREEDIQEGDQIVTSGIGGIWPKGLLVGKVTKVEKGDEFLFKLIEIEPSTDFSKLEELFIIAKADSTS